MANTMARVKFTLDSGTVSAFKARCMSEGVSMTSAIRQCMRTHQPIRDVKTKTLTRPRRKKAVTEIVSLLSDILEKEEAYRDLIPEQFTQRQEVADQFCERLEEAIACLEDAF